VSSACVLLLPPVFQSNPVRVRPELNARKVEEDQTFASGPRANMFSSSGRFAGFNLSNVLGKRMQMKEREAKVKTVIAGKYKSVKE
jgi:hypothetical protein